MSNLGQDAVTDIKAGTGVTIERQRNSFTINVPGTGGTIDHGVLNGLSDDDHTQYLLVDGTRSMAGVLNMNGNPITNCDSLDGANVGSNSISWLADNDNNDNNTIIGQSSTSGGDDNVIFGGSNTGGGNNNVIVGIGNSAGGTNNTIVGNNISINEGDNIIYMGSNVAITGTNSNYFAAVIGSTEFAYITDVLVRLAEGTFDLNASRLALSALQSGASDGDVLAYSSSDGGYVNTTPSSGVSDHGALSGLGDDDHTQYLLADGTRKMAGALDMDGHEIRGVNVIGDSASAGGLFALAVGEASNASGATSTALGTAATATANDTTAVGYNADASGTDSTAIGYNSVAGQTRSVAIGHNATTTSTASLAFPAFSSLSSSTTFNQSHRLRVKFGNNEYWLPLDAV